jgi:hypothetical protein
MRRALVSACVFLGLLPASASAYDYVGAPITHGTDSAAVGTGPAAKLPRALAKSLPKSWCGPETAGDDTVHELDNGGYKEHAVYMIPSDGVDRFAHYAPGIQADAFGASALLETTYARAIRFDMGTACGPEYLDITVVRMPYSTAQLQAAASSGTGTFDMVTGALNAAGLQTIKPSDSYQQAGARTRNWVVWFDGPAPAGTCGQASIYDDPTRAPTNLNNFGGKVAVVFRSGDGFCSSNAVRHEIGHNLGALQPSAPHAFDGSHCNDAIEDTMCYSNSPQVANGQRGLFFDYKNDDYWDPAGGALPWWTVNLNRFLCPDAGCNHAPGPDTVAAGADSDGDGVIDAVDNCPTVANPDQENNYGGPKGDACEKRRTKAKLRVRAKHHGTLWRLVIRAKGHGRGVITVRCRKHRGGQVRTVYTRRTRLPRTIHRKVRCRASKPTTRLLVSPRSRRS